MSSDGVAARLAASGYDPDKVRQMARDLFENWRCEVDDPRLAWVTLDEPSRRGWYRAAMFALAYARLGGGR